jgi:hypothetical protein
LAKHGRTPTKDKSRKGDIAEHYAITYLWDQGYEVYKNCGCTGPIDLIAKRGDLLTLVDVKSVAITRFRTAQSTEEQKRLGVAVLYFEPVTRAISFSLEELRQQVTDKILNSLETSPNEQAA